MRIFLPITTVLALASLATPAFAGVNQRQAHQQRRISKGIQSGQLTAREVNRVQKQQSRIAAYEAQSRADGNGWSRAERKHIKKMQDRASRTIYRQKHDAQRN